jgi:hypothetical protein
MSNQQPPFRVQHGYKPSGPDDPCAVLVSTGRATVRMTIAEARELSLELQRVADEAELKLPE